MYEFQVLNQSASDKVSLVYFPTLHFQASFLPFTHEALLLHELDDKMSSFSTTIIPQAK